MPQTKTAAELLDTTELETFRRDLEIKRQELTDLYRHDLRVGQESSDDSADDSVDRANNSFNRELMFLLSDTEREMLIQIEDAVQRLEKGSFGACINCEKPIGKPRLAAIPWARHCIGCQELEENGALEG